MKIGLIGCGVIGKSIIEAMYDGRIEGSELVVIGDKYMYEEAEKLAKEHHCAAVKNISEFLNYSLDIVVEAASQEALWENLPLLLENGIDVMSVSVGAYTDTEFFEKVKKLAQENNCKLYIPSGAVGGIDLLLGANQAELEEVTLTTRKPPKGLEDASGKSLQDEEITEPKVVYEGYAEDAIKKFPKNVNVAAAISLAALGFHKTKVKIVADPTISRNIHMIEAKGEFGSFKGEFCNMPSPANPKTSYLAPLSSIALLSKISSNISVGT